MQKHTGRKSFIPLCTKYIDIISKLHQFFEFRNYITFLKGIEISKKYESRIYYVHKSLNELTRLVQNTNMDPIK